MRKFSCFLLICIFLSCNVEEKQADVPNYMQLLGRTMGTTYKIVYQDSLERNFKEDIDALLVSLNREVNTYDTASTISLFNKNLIDESDSTWLDQNPNFKKNALIALEISEKTDGAYDPTIMPLINHWGFGYTEKKKVSETDQAVVDSFKNFVGLEFLKVEGLNEETSFAIEKSDERLELDFGGIAKGYGLDLVAGFLESKNIQNYMIEIGLEVRTKGISPKGKAWRIGISTPKPGAALTDIQEIVQLNDLSVATSGNYRQVYEVEGQKYAHIVNPKTGLPEFSNLLSVSVFMRECVYADAYATAFYVMGLDKAYKFASENNEMEALFIYSDQDGELQVKFTEGMNEILVNTQN